MRFTSCRRPPQSAQANARDFTVYFDFDKYNLTGDARRVVDAAIAAAKAGGPARIDVTGNTDLAGTNRYNLVLSRHRAETVRNYMVAHGVDPGEINIGARGKTDPIVRTADGVREPRNRRVEIVVNPSSLRPAGHFDGATADDAGQRDHGIAAAATAAGRTAGAATGCGRSADQPN